MELFLPGLIVLLVSAFFAFMVIPRMGSVVLITVCTIALFAAAWHHFSVFGAEYRQSSWQYALAAYAPAILVGLALIFIIVALVSLFSGNSVQSVVAAPINIIQNAASSAASSMPNANTATNPLTASINRTLNANANSNRGNTVKSRIPALNYTASEV